MARNLLFFLQFVAVATLASCLTLDKRATGGYVQNPSGQASFTHYSGCGQPGASYLARLTPLVLPPSLHPTFSPSSSVPALTHPQRAASPGTATPPP